MIDWFRTWGRSLSLLFVLSDFTKAAFRHSVWLWYGGFFGLGIWLLTEHQKQLLDRCEQLGKRLAEKVERKLNG